MRIPETAVALTLVLSALACGRGDRTEGAATTEDTIPAYNPDTLAWVKQDRPVVFDDRGWLRTGETVKHPSVVRAGQFEGTVLYAPADETLPYQRLLIPVGDGRWQMLEPIARVPEPGSDTVAPKSARQTLPDRSPTRHVKH
ncbi:MAG TPA: hypothetical protein VJ957_07810 [Longimicrobiales bacterium]|nr:hypothetical protein [Longimicrobiales bacterium]